MDVAVALHRIWWRRVWLIPVVLVAALVGLSVAYKVSLFPPSLESRSFSYGAARTDVLVDTARSSVVTLSVPLDTLIERTRVYADLIKTEPVRQRIGEAAGVPWQTIAVDGFSSARAALPGSTSDPTAAEAAVQNASEGVGRTVFYRVEDGQPIIRISAQAKNAAEAEALASAVVVALPGYIDQLQDRQGISGPKRVVFTQIGEPRGAVVGASTDVMLASLTGIAVFLFGCFLILLVPRAFQGFRRAEELHLEAEIEELHREAGIVREANHELQTDRAKNGHGDPDARERLELGAPPNDGEPVQQQPTRPEAPH